MSTPDSTPPRPERPAGCPLFYHATGQWAKKYKGRTVYFGKDLGTALVAYQEWLKAPNSDRTAPEPDSEFTVKRAFNAFMTAVIRRVAAGEMNEKTQWSYQQYLNETIKHLRPGTFVADLRPLDFASLRSKLAVNYKSPNTLTNAISVVRSVFLYCYESELIPAVPRFGPAFKRPAMKTKRLHRARKGERLASREEIHKLLAAASIPLRAMILLAINGGLGNNDVAQLRFEHLDLDGGWINFPRPKTGTDRRVPLWSETVAAIRLAIEKRREPRNESHRDLVFIRHNKRTPWCRQSGQKNCPVADEFGWLLAEVGIVRKGLSFYALRHTFRTVGDEAKDQPAIDHVMGHVSSHISTVYREKIGDDRLRAVVDHVHRWLFS
jgi:integrase